MAVKVIIKAFFLLIFMTMGKLISFFFTLLIFGACNQRKDKSKDEFNIQDKKITGKLIPEDSVGSPRIVKAGIPKKYKLDKIIAASTNTEIVTAGKPNEFILDELSECTPGKDTFLLPIILNIRDSSFFDITPEIVVSKDPIVKDLNSKSLSYFNQLSGLKTDAVFRLMQDKIGNVWFATWGGGVTRYDGKYFTNYSKAEGLSDNVVYSILQDKKDNIWFGTDNGGLTKYDGKKFTYYDEKLGFPNNTVNSILEDRSGNLWFATFGGGLIKYDGNSFTQYTTKQGLNDNIISSLALDSKGNIWMSNESGTISKFDGKKFVHYYNKECLNKEFIYALKFDKNGALWISTFGKGVLKYDGRLLYQYTTKQGLAEDYVISIYEDIKNNMWFGTEAGGVSKFNGKYFTNITENQGLPSNQVSAILSDSVGNIWFGTRNGVAKLSGERFKHFNSVDGLIKIGDSPENIVNGMIQDSLGNIWMGRNGCLTKYDSKTFYNYINNEFLTKEIIFEIASFKGCLWLNVGNGVLKFDGSSFSLYNQQTGLACSSVNNIFADKNSRLWIVGYDGVSSFDGINFTNYTYHKGLPTKDIFGITQDKENNIWFGSIRDGAYKYDGNLFYVYSRKDGLSSNFVYTIKNDAIGNIWFGTPFGASCYNGKEINSFNKKQGLISDGVNSLLVDKNGNIWLGGFEGGLSLLQKSKLKAINDPNKLEILIKEKNLFKNYGFQDGFFGRRVNRNSILETTDGKIWIGANDRLTVYDLNEDVKDSIAPNIQLTSLDLFGEPIIWQNLLEKDSSFSLENGINIHDYCLSGVSKWYQIPESLSLSYENNNITFNYIGISTYQSNKILYRFKLEGIDKNWSVLSDKNTTTYANLLPGKYTFLVKARSCSNKWSNEFSYTFIIRPPFWQTWWFRTIIIAFIISCIWLYIKWRERSLKQRQKTLEVKIDEATFEIKEQKHVIEEKHREITDSINYAERIQRSFLATKELLDQNLKEYFVVFKPKDVVSGDFYWAGRLNNGNFALVTADSTGHGVPGAIMSLLNITSLEKAIEDNVDPSTILNQTRRIIIDRLKKDGSSEGGKDGMDCSLISFDFISKKIIYSAANNPIWVIRDKEILEFAPDKMPVGKHDRDTESFTEHKVELQNGDMVYTITDGLPDQFGGPKGKKFMYKQLKELLISITHLPMQEQKESLTTALQNWKGDLEQVDDVTIIGVRV